MNAQNIRFDGKLTTCYVAQFFFNPAENIVQKGHDTCKLIIGAAKQAFMMTFPETFSLQPLVIDILVSISYFSLFFYPELHVNIIICIRIINSHSKSVLQAKFCLEAKLVDSQHF